MQPDTVPRPAGAPAPKYEWPGVSPAMRQEIELHRADMLRELHPGDGEYWLGDETYRADGTITIACHFADRVVLEHLRWVAAEKCFVGVEG